MTRHTNSGFTIIETMLFLAVSAALFAAIMVGVGVSVERQRYRDSVNSLRSHLQVQFAQAVNVNNTRTAGETCTASGGTITVSPTGGSMPRGTSECVLLGRFVRSSDGVTVTSGNILGLRVDTPNESYVGWRDVVSNYLRRESPSHQETYQVAWGNRTQPFSLLFVRSPQNGAMYTISVPSGPVVGGPGIGIAAINLCVEGEPSGLKRVGVHIPAGATSQSAIQVMTEAGSTC